MTLIEKLEALHASINGDYYQGQEWERKTIKEIIEQAKAEKQEPIARVLTLSNLGFSTRGSIEWIGNKYSLPPNALLYTAPQPDIVAELVKALEHSRECLEAANNSDLINDTLWAGNAETLFDYMDTAIAKAKEMMG